MLLRDADVEAARGVRLGELVEPGARRHGGGQRHDLLVALRLLDQAVREHAGIARRLGLALLLLARHHVELAERVATVRCALGRLVALALAGDDMEQHRPRRLVLADVAQHRDQVVEIVAVDRPDIEEAELLEEGATRHHAAGILLGPHRRIAHRLGQLARPLLAELAQAAELVARQQPREIGVQRAHRRRDRHLVVVQDDDEARRHGARIVHRLVGHAARHGAVADDADDVARFARNTARHRHAEAGRDRRGRMRRAEGVVLALGPLGEAVEPAGLADGANLVAPPGDDLVRVGLMPHVPDQAVAGGVEHMVEGDRQLDHAEACTQVAARHRDRVDGLGTKLSGNLLEFLDREAAQVFGAVHAVQMRRLQHGSLSVSFHRSARGAARSLRDQHDKPTTKGILVKRPVTGRRHACPPARIGPAAGTESSTLRRLGKAGRTMYPCVPARP